MELRADIREISIIRGFPDFKLAGMPIENPKSRNQTAAAGVLNLSKPSGMTSRRVVDLVQRLVRPAKAGHAGTLDPLASGVLVVCVGSATRLIDYVQRMPKRYTG